MKNKQKKVTFEQLQKATIRQQISHRGGGIEISLSPFGFKGERMTAYQNYLGGGLLGRIMSDCTIPAFEDNEKLSYIAEQLREYMHSLTNPDGEWESSSYQENQLRPGSAY